MDYEALRALNEHNHASRREEREGAYTQAASQFGQAQRDAARAGLVLIRRSQAHYQLRAPEGWLINIYPGNGRLYPDKKRPKPPFLRVPPIWTLADVVAAAVKQRTPKE